MMIFPWKNWKDTLMKGTSPGAVGKCYPSGWIQSEILIELFELVLSNTRSKAEAPVLLLLDGHNIKSEIVMSSNV